MIVSKEMLPKVAQKLLQYAHEHANANGATVLALTGNLGAGKTTLTQHLAEALSVKERAVSPTFVLMRRYQTNDSVFTSLVHIDAYRIENEEELRPLKLDSLFSEQGTFVCIEWPANMGTKLPASAIHISLEVRDGEERELTGTPELESYLQK